MQPFGQVAGLVFAALCLGKLFHESFWISPKPCTMPEDIHCSINLPASIFLRHLAGLFGQLFDKRITYLRHIRQPEKPARFLRRAIDIKVIFSLLTLIFVP